MGNVKVRTKWILRRNMFFFKILLSILKKMMRFNNVSLQTIRVKYL